MERYASPFSVAYANTSNKNVFDALTKAFSDATKINGLIVPPQCKIELKEVMVSSMADGYAKFIEMLNVAKTVAILGQSLSTSAKGGAGFGSGVADLQGEVRSDWSIYDQDAFGSMEEKQIFSQYLKINGCKGRVPKSRRGGLTIGNQSLKAKTLVDLRTAGVAVDETSISDLSKQFGTKLRIMSTEELHPTPKGNGNPKDN
jgi:phage gp29-like protein